MANMASMYFGLQGMAAGASTVMAGVEALGVCAAAGAVAEAGTAGGATAVVVVVNGAAVVVIVIGGAVFLYSGSVVVAGALSEIQLLTARSSKEGGGAHMLGSGGATVPNYKPWQRGTRERVEVENQAPGKRPADVHYHEPDNTKWRFDPDTNTLRNPKTGSPAPPRVQAVLDESVVRAAINKCFAKIGEPLPFPTE